MVRVTAEQTIRCTPEEALEFVMDIERYAQVNDKIGPIDWARREGNLTEFKFLPADPAWRTGASTEVRVPDAAHPG